MHVSPLSGTGIPRARFLGALYLGQSTDDQYFARNCLTARVLDTTTGGEDTSHYPLCRLGSTVRSRRSVSVADKLAAETPTTASEMIPVLLAASTSARGGTDSSEPRYSFGRSTPRLDASAFELGSSLIKASSKNE